MSAAVGEASAWRIETSPYECIAEWDTWLVSVVLLDNEETRRICREVAPSKSCDKPVLMWVGVRFDVWDLAPETYDRTDVEGNVTFNVDVRLFPDEQQGFFSIPVTIKNDFDRGLEMGASSLVWWGFDLHARLQKWGTAKETMSDPGVRLPEVRLILRYEKGPREGHWDLPDHVRRGHLDVPLWRTSNMMNKMLRCSENFEDA